MSSGKGSRRRKMSVSQEKYCENWNKIFKKTEQKQKKKQKKED